MNFTLTAKQEEICGNWFYEIQVNGVTIRTHDTWTLPWVFINTEHDVTECVKQVRSVAGALEVWACNQ